VITGFLFDQNNPVIPFLYCTRRAKMRTGRIITMQAGEGNKVQVQGILHFSGLDGGYLHPPRADREVIFLLAGDLTSKTSDALVQVD
jgi:hypothetical protein